MCTSGVYACTCIYYLETIGITCTYGTCHVILLYIHIVYFLLKIYSHKIVQITPADTVVSCSIAVKVVYLTSGTKKLSFPFSRKFIHWNKQILYTIYPQFSCIKPIFYFHRKVQGLLPVLNRFNHQLLSIST